MNLLSIQGRGAVYAILLLILCFTLVHIFKLARIGYRARRDLPPTPPKTEAPRPEPVYYIVEKKKKRAKASYSEPRRIDFKEDQPSSS